MAKFKICEIDGISLTITSDGLFATLVSEPCFHLRVKWLLEKEIARRKVSEVSIESESVKCLITMLERMALELRELIGDD